MTTTQLDAGRAGPSAWKRFVPILVLVLVALAARVALFSPDSNLSPDAVDYVNIARNVAEGRGFVHSIKWHFFTSDPVVRPAAGERPPLYPLMLSVVWSLGGRVAAIDWINVFLGVAAIVVLYLLYVRVLDWRWPAFAAALLAALNPSVAKACTFPWTEPLFLFLHAAALLLLIGSLQSGRNGLRGRNGQDRIAQVSGQLDRSDWLALAAGALAALAYLARPNGVVLLIASVAVLALARRWRVLGLFLLPNVLILGLWFGVVWEQKGSPTFSVQQHHFRVHRIDDGMRSGWGVEIPSRKEFAAANPVGALAAENGWRYALELFGRPFLGFPLEKALKWGRLGNAVLFVLLVAGMALLAIWTLKRLGGRGALLALCALGHFALISLVWATHEGDRLLQPVYLLLVPLVVGALFDVARLVAKRWPHPAVRSVAWGIALVVPLAWASFFVHDLVLTRQILRQRPPFPLATDEERNRIDSLVPDDAVIASDDPFIANWLLDRPTIYLPSTATHLNADQFFHEYNVRLVVPLNLREQLLAGQVARFVRNGLIQPLKGDLLPGLNWFLVKTGPPPPSTPPGPVAHSPEGEPAQGPRE